MNTRRMTVDRHALRRARWRVAATGLLLLLPLLWSSCRAERPPPRPPAGPPAGPVINEDTAAPSPTPPVQVMERLLYSFEAGVPGQPIQWLADRSKNLGIVAATAEGVTDGERCVQITTKPGEQWAEFILDDERVRDWSGFNCFAMDLYAEDDRPIEVNFELWDYGSSNFLTRSTHIYRPTKQGQQTLIFRVDLAKRNSEQSRPWSELAGHETIDLSRLKMVKVFLTPPKDRPAVLRIDNLRLLKEDASNFVLLYDVMGCEQLATKRALVRTVFPIKRGLISEAASIWRVIDSDGRQVMTGPITDLGTTFGIQFWEVDFTTLRHPGMYRLDVTLRDSDGIEITTLESLPFDIERRLHFERMARPLAVHNARARAAGDDFGGGYFDSDSNMGEAYSHGMFLAGLCKAYEAWQADLSEDDRQGLADAAARAADYLLQIHDERTGEIAHEHPSRPGQSLNLGDHNTRMGAYGLACFVAAFGDADPERAERVVPRVVRSIQYLEDRDALGPSLRATIFAHLFRHTGERVYGDQAVLAVDELLERFEWPDTYEQASRAPCFEGLYYAFREIADEPKRDRWLRWAERLERKQLRRIPRQNAFHILLTQAEDTRWQSGLPPAYLTTEDDKIWGGSCQLARLAYDMAVLADITGNRAPLDIATGALSWIAGLHPGIRGRLVTNPASNDRLASAAFISGLDARHGSAYSWAWRLPLNTTWMSVMSGLAIQNGHWVFADHWFTRETHIQHDGMYLAAISLYDRLMSDANDLLRNEPEP